jgi:hypothetical protein
MILALQGSLEIIKYKRNRGPEENLQVNFQTKAPSY